MIFRGSICAVLMAAVLAIATEPVKAFYDDTHYSLTYYIARSCGFTPLQSYRLASAAVSIDYAPLTRPEQYGAFLPSTTPSDFLTESAHSARITFHAFWDSRSPVQFDPVAKGRYLESERRLFVLATSQRNAGVLLHYVQDEEPHAGYGSTRGHWGVAPIDPIWPFGAQTDYLSFNQQRTMLMVQHSVDTLKSFMLAMAPRQRPSARCTVAGVLPMLNTLIAANPVSVMSAPKVTIADAAVAAAVTAQADLTMHASFENREQYTFDAVGRIMDKAESYPMYESLKASVRGGEGRQVEVSVWAAPTRAFEKSYQLDCKPASGLTLFDKLPVGNLILQTVADGKVTRTPFRLDKSGQSVQLSVTPIKKGEEASECRKEVAKRAASVCESGRGALTSRAPINGTESQRLEDDFQQAADSCDKEEEKKQTENNEPPTQQTPPGGNGGGGHGVGTAIKAGSAIAVAAVGGLYLKSELAKIEEESVFTTTPTTTTTTTTTTPTSSGSMTYVGGTFTCTFNAGGVLNLCNNSNIRVNITARMAVGTSLRLNALGMTGTSILQTTTDPPGNMTFQNFNGPGNFDTCPGPIQQLSLFNASTAAPITAITVSIPVSCR